MAESLQDTGTNDFEHREQVIYAGIRAVMRLSKEHLIEDFRADRVIDEYLDELNELQRERGRIACIDVEVSDD